MISKINAAPWPLTTAADALRKDDIAQRVRGMKATFSAMAVATLANLLAFIG